MRLIRTRRRPTCEINITPLIDIVFLLIIFSMVLSQFSKLRAEKLALPEARKGAEPKPVEGARIVVNVLPDGRMVVFRRQQSLESLTALLAAKAAQAGPAGVSVVIRGDRRSPWRVAGRVLQACAARGIARVKVAVVEPGEGGGTRGTGRAK